ncbi:hypothetical protein HDU78_004048, partial [Chytriomyces hyalinus]
QQQYYKSNGAPQCKAPEYKAPEYKAPEYKEEYKQSEYKSPTEEKSYGGDETYRSSLSWPLDTASTGASPETLSCPRPKISSYTTSSARQQIQITVKGDKNNSKDVCLTGEKKNYGDFAFAERLS